MTVRPARLLLSTCAAILLIAAASAGAQDTAPSPAPAAAAPNGPAFDVKAATDAYLAKMTPEQKAHSDAYFEGGYWLQLWDFLYGAAVALLFLGLRWSARMRDLAERVTRVKAVQAALYWAQYLVLATVIGFPLTIYEGYFREHQYGMPRRASVRGLATRPRP